METMPAHSWNTTHLIIFLAVVPFPSLFTSFFLVDFFVIVSYILHLIVGLLPSRWPSPVCLSGFFLNTTNPIYLTPFSQECQQGVVGHLAHSGLFLRSVPPGGGVRMDPQNSGWKKSTFGWVPTGPPPWGFQEPISAPQAEGKFGHCIFLHKFAKLHVFCSGGIIISCPVSCLQLPVGWDGHLHKRIRAEEDNNLNRKKTPKRLKVAWWFWSMDSHSHMTVLQFLCGLLIDQCQVSSLSGYR